MVKIKLGEGGEMGLAPPPPTLFQYCLPPPQVPTPHPHCSLSPPPPLYPTPTHWRILDPPLLVPEFCNMAISVQSQIMRNVGQ